MTSPAPTHPSYDLSFLGHLFTAASQLQQKGSDQADLRQQKPLVADQQKTLPDQHQSSSASPPPDHHHEEMNTKPHHIHQESPASVSVMSSLTEPPSGSSPVSPIAPSARPSLSHIPVQLSENDHCIRLRFNLKGIKNSDIYVGVQHGILMVQGTRFVRYAEDDSTAPQDKDTDSETGSVVQRHRFCRRFAIDTDVVDISKIQANLSGAGILTVIGPKKSSPSSVRVNVTEEHDEDKQEQEDQEETKNPEGAQYDSIVSFLLDQANAAGRDNNGMGGNVSLSSFSGSGSHSSGSHSSASEDDDTMEDAAARSPSKKRKFSQ